MALSLTCVGSLIKLLGRAELAAIPLDTLIELTRTLKKHTDI